jgi:hypothetical protein
VRGHARRPCCRGGRLSVHAAPHADAALVRVVGPPGSGKTLLIVALAEELRRRGHRVGSAEARGGALVIALPSGGRVTAPAPAPDAAASGALLLLARRLDPQLALLLLEESSEADGSAVAPAGTPTIELVPAGGTPHTLSAQLLAAVSTERIAGAFSVVGPGDTLGLAALVEQLLGAAAGRSLDVAAEPPPPATRRAEGGRIALVRWLGRALQGARDWRRRGRRGGSER